MVNDKRLFEKRKKQRIVVTHLSLQTTPMQGEDGVVIMATDGLFCTCAIHSQRQEFICTHRRAAALLSFLVVWFTVDSAPARNRNKYIWQTARHRRESTTLHKTAAAAAPQLPGSSRAIKCAEPKRDRGRTRRRRPTKYVMKLRNFSVFVWFYGARCHRQLRVSQQALYLDLAVADCLTVRYLEENQTYARQEHVQTGTKQCLDSSRNVGTA